MLSRSALACLVLVFAATFGWLSVQRHEAYRTNAEDLAFTDQSLWYFLRGQAFRFSLYQQAEFTTDIDPRALKRPDSFLAFHVEPMLALIAPLYLVWSDVRAILVLQAVGWALGAIPAYRLARRRLGSTVAGLGFAAAYLLSPLGQWAVLSDFHTVTLAAPLLLWAADLADSKRPIAFLLVGLLAASAKEEVGLAVAGLGALYVFRQPILPRLRLNTPGMRRAGVAALLLGTGWSAACITLIVPRYAGTAVSPFTVRYAELGGSPGQLLLNLVRAPQLFVDALTRPEVEGYGLTLLLAGGWLALLAPELLLPAVPSLALNVLSNSPWMASGRAHYSAVVLPFVMLAAIGGAERLLAIGGRGERSGTAPILALLVLATSLVAYQRAGAGPLAEHFVPPQRTAHHALADRLLADIPPDAKVSASSSLAPHLSQRTDLYLFPTIREADFVALDVSATAFPINAGDVYQRASTLLASGEWTARAAADGLLLLERSASGNAALPDRFFEFVRAAPLSSEAPLSPGAVTAFLDGALELVSADLGPSGEVGPNGPLGTLTTVWRTTRPIDTRPRPHLVLRFGRGFEVPFADFAALWWYPPERWRPGELVKLEARGVELRDLVGWYAVVPPPQDAQLPPAGDLPSASERSTVSGAPGAAQPDADLAELRVGELTVQVRRSSWQMTVLDPRGRALWREAPLTPGERRGPLGYGLADGSWWHLSELLDVASGPDGGTLRVATDDPAGRTATVRLTALGPRSFRLALALSSPEAVASIGQTVLSPEDEKLLGFGERFTAVNQRGRVLTTWAEDRRVAGYGDSTYAPLPFFLSSRGYSLALEHDQRSTFDLGVERADRYSWEVAASELSYVFSYGPTPRDLVREQVTRTGLPPLPPSWAFGVWKTAIGGRERVLQDAERLRQVGIPVSALYVYDAVDSASNIGWPYGTFQGRPAGPYSDASTGPGEPLRGLTDTLHAQGYKVLSYNTADFHADRPNWAFPAAQGFFLQAADGQPYVHPGFQVSWVDFSNPAAVDWWRQLWRRSLVDLGFDGGMLDLGELTPENAHYANGLDGRAMHNRYPGLYARAAFEAAALHKPDAVLFVRSGGIGAQAHQHLQWPGDPLIDWSEEGGFKSLLPAALSFGLSGFPYWHPEVGGYLAVGLPRESERELWLRWLQLGAFSTTLRDAYGDHQTGQEPVEMWSDEGTIAAYRTYARLHNRLVPYLYSYARVASETGLPLLRHLALGWPDDARAWAEESQYTLGEELLVAPVLDEGARARSVYLPAGQWADFWTGRIYEGGREIVADAPLDRIPVFARAGAVLPLAADFDTLAPAGDSSVRSWAGDLVLRVVPSIGAARSSFRLYDGSQLSFTTDGSRATLRVRGAPAERGIEARIPVAVAPGRVLLDGSPASDWRYEAASGEAVVRTRSADLEIMVE